MNRQEEKFDRVAKALQEALLEQARKTYSPRVIELFSRPVHQGTLENANGFGVVKGICGDTMKIYLKISRGRVCEAKYETDGCGATIACGEAVAAMAKGKSLKEIMRISPGALLENLGGLPPSHLHCSILAVNTLYSALANYLVLRPRG